MITTQKRNGRLAVLCVVCVIAFMAFLGIVNGVTADGIAHAFAGAPVTSYSSTQSYQLGASMIPHQIHPLHGGRDWQIAEVQDIFADSVVVSPVQNTPISSANSRSYSSVAETQFIGQGVALIPDYSNGTRGNRDWKISHL